MPVQCLRKFANFYLCVIGLDV